MEDYYVLNAKYNKNEKAWHYNSDEGYDTGNIIAFKKREYYKSSAHKFSFYYINKAEEARGNILVHYYNEILEYYNKVFGDNDIKKFDVVSLGIIDGVGPGAYFRKELLVSERMDFDLGNEKELRLNTASLLSHELGHNWFSGASFDTWEDWLNETGATWASLLYALDSNNDELFKKLLGEAEQIYKNSTLIKTTDLKRPDGVHGSGTMLLYEIYKKYGKKPILAFLNTFIELQDKTTENLLVSLKHKIGNEIPAIIQKGLTMTDYSEICR